MTRDAAGPAGGDVADANAPAVAERLTVNLIAEASDALRAAAVLTGDTRTDVVNRALQVYAAAVESDWVTLGEGRAGRVLRVGVPPHECRPPEIVRFEAPEPGEPSLQVDGLAAPRIVVEFREGSLWECACGRVWETWIEPGRRYGRTSVFGGLRWRPERRLAGWLRRRRERRQLEASEAVIRRTRGGPW